MYGEENRVVKLPTPRQLREISASYNLDHSDANVKSFLEAVCESLCFSGGSHTFDTGLVLNPHDHSRSASGSSSGSAALAGLLCIRGQPSGKEHAPQVIMAFRRRSRTATPSERASISAPA